MFYSESQTDREWHHFYEPSYLRSLWELLLSLVCLGIHPDATWILPDAPWVLPGDIPDVPQMHPIHDILAK